MASEPSSSRDVGNRTSTASTAVISSLIGSGTLGCEGPVLSRGHGDHPSSCVEEMSSHCCGRRWDTLDMGWIYRVVHSGCPYLGSKTYGSTRLTCEFASKVQRSQEASHPISSAVMGCIATLPQPEQRAGS